MSYLLLGDFPMAMKVIAEYRKTQNVGQVGGFECGRWECVIGECGYGKRGGVSLDMYMYM